MHYASREDVKKLIKQSSNTKSISIYLPTHRIPQPQNIQEDKLRLKNAIQFINRSLDETEDKALLKLANKEMQKLYDDLDFWKNRDNGLSLFINESKMWQFDLPIETETCIYIEDSFVISPLVAASHDNYAYYLLDLNLEKPRMFHANQTSVKQILIEDMPKDIETELRIDEYQQSLQHGTSRGGKHDATHHGHGARDDHKNNDVKKYLRRVAQTISNNELHDKSNPLIIAADEKTREMFTRVLKYKHVLQTNMDGNFSETSENELHRMSWEIMLDYINESQMKLQDNDADKNKIILNKIDDIVSAAKRGELINLTLGMIHSTHDSVVNRLEERFKIAIPEDNDLLQKIETSLRNVISKGGEISSLITNRDNNRVMYGATYNSYA